MDRYLPRRHALHGGQFTANDRRHIERCINDVLNQNNAKQQLY